MQQPTSSLLHRLFKPRCGLELRCVVAEGAALRHVPATINTPGHDTVDLPHEWQIECRGVRPAGNCEGCPRLQLVRKFGRALLDHRRVWMRFVSAQQGHIFDEHRYVPGVYHIDPQALRAAAKLFQLSVDDYTRPIPAHGPVRIEQPQGGAEQRDRQGNCVSHSHVDPSAATPGECIDRGR